MPVLNPVCITNSCIPFLKSYYFFMKIVLFILESEERQNFLFQGSTSQQLKVSNITMSFFSFFKII